MAYFIGFFLTSLLIPMVALIIFKLIPATRHRHRLNYGVSGGIGVLLTWAANLDGLNEQNGRLTSMLGSILMAAVFYVGYRLALRGTTQTIATANSGAVDSNRKGDT